MVRHVKTTPFGLLSVIALSVAVQGCATAGSSSSESSQAVWFEDERTAIRRSDARTPDLADIPQTPTDVRKPEGFRAAAKDVMALGARTKQVRLTPTTTRTPEEFASAAQARVDATIAPYDELMGDVTSTVTSYSSN